MPAILRVYAHCTPTQFLYDSCSCMSRTTKKVFVCDNGTLSSCHGCDSRRNYCRVLYFVTIRRVCLQGSDGTGTYVSLCAREGHECHGDSKEGSGTSLVLRASNLWHVFITIARFSCRTLSCPKTAGHMSTF